jgi:hypothetical protein
MGTKVILGCTTKMFSSMHDLNIVTYGAGYSDATLRPERQNGVQTKIDMVAVLGGALIDLKHSSRCSVGRRHVRRESPIIVPFVSAQVADFQERLYQKPSQG